MYDEDVLTAGVGSFHEAKAGDVYLVFKGEVPHSAMQPVSDKNRLGRAELSELGEKDSRLRFHGYPNLSPEFLCGLEKKQTNIHFNQIVRSV